MPSLSINIFYINLKFLLLFLLHSRPTICVDIFLNTPAAPVIN
jgi:hypothetical protein